MTAQLHDNACDLHYAKARRTTQHTAYTVTSGKRWIGSVVQVQEGRCWWAYDTTLHRLPDDYRTRDAAARCLLAVYLGRDN
jgi:hypothetical protein